MAESERAGLKDKVLEERKRLRLKREKEAAVAARRTRAVGDISGSGGSGNSQIGDLPDPFTIQS
jgi:hypothetical protein